MHELTINLHIHTTYSDGTGSHADVVAAALQAGLDAVIVTDHNVLVQGMEGYHRRGRKRMLLLVGEEVHDQARQPQKSHLLVVGAGRELATSAGQPQGLVDAVRTAGGLSFIAHPVDPALPVFNEDDISWEDWDVHGFTGIELWNGFSEIKTVVRSRLGALPYAYFPELVGHGPLPQTLEIWDRLLSRGAKVVAVGGSDAHALKMSMGPLRRTIFPYRFHFSAVNTHLLVEKPLCGEIETDRRMVYAALAAGHAFIGYDLPGATHGFRFSASSRERTALMGDEIPVSGGVTLQVRLPQRCEYRLLADGKPVRSGTGETLTQAVTEPGVYRVEAYHNFLGRRRGWIFSNPIYIR